jgi:hypothetical protein
MSTSSTTCHSMLGLTLVQMRRKGTVSIAASLVACRRSYTQETTRLLGLWWTLPLPCRDCSVTLRQNGSASRWPISLWVGIHFNSLSRPIRHLPPSTVHLLSKCNNSSPRDSRSHLIKDRGTSLLLVSSVARKATMPTSLHSLLSL